jgi:hypothetical protein
MSTYIVAALLASFLFSAFVLFHRPDCDGSSCGSGASCGACPKSHGDTEHSHA